MAAGPAKLLSVDVSVEGLFSWQRLKSLSIAQTAITAAQLSQNLSDISFTEDTVEFINVQNFNSIRCQVWGVANDNHAPVIDLYGWSLKGGGGHIGKVTLAYGNFTSAASTGFHASASAHQSIKEMLNKDTAYRSCDTYTVSNDYELETVADSGGVVYESARTVIAPRTAAAASPIKADFPSYFDVDFSRSRWAYFGVLVTTLAGTTLGAIFKPTILRR